MIRGDEPNIVACMEPPERDKRLAKRHRAIAGYELAEQKKFAGWLRKMRKASLLNYLWPRTDKATTIQVGHWDFTIWLPGGRELRMEFKAPGGKCSLEQQQTIALMAKLEHPVLLMDSAAKAQSLVEIALDL
jgi:hypothetical protein